MWGITASDSAKGYVVWGGPPCDSQIDGTIVPAAAGGSLMFTPELSLAALKMMREKFGNQIYGRYGFIDAFNPVNGWVDRDVIGINLGITLLSTENARTENVWHWFMKNREIPSAMELIGLRRSRIGLRQPVTGKSPEQPHVSSTQTTLILRRYDDWKVALYTNRDDEPIEASKRLQRGKQRDRNRQPARTSCATHYEDL